MLTTSQVESLAKRLSIRLQPGWEMEPIFEIYGRIFDKILDRIEEVEQNLSDHIYGYTE